MSDVYYDIVYAIGCPIFWSTSRPVVLHAERTDRKGPYILASTHMSPFDVPLLIRHSYRRLDFVSIVEVFRNRFVAWFYGSMNAFPLDRSRPDSPTVRTILQRLQRGRVVAMFPEGRIRTREDSVVNGGRIKPGAARLAQMANVPIIPAVVVNAAAYSRFSAWLPINRVRYGVIFGHPLEIRQSLGKEQAARAMEEALREQFVQLYHELLSAMPA